MALKNILFLYLLMLPLCMHAQFGLGKKKTGSATILNTPSIGDYVLHDPEYRSSFRLMDGYPDEKSAWIVYSDRDNNTTYQNPGNEKQPLAALNFMQACFVIGEKDGYLELAEYVPRVNMSKGKKILEDPKYLGWVNKNTLLLWNRALKDKVTNYYLKTLTAFGTQRIFEILQQHVSGDSIITFSNPFLNQPAGKCSMGNLFYIYKESVLGNEYLVGPDQGFLPEHATQSGFGWISKDLVRIWGTKGFISVNPDLKASIPFYQSAPLVKNGQAGQDTIFTLHSPYTIPKSDLEKLYPVIQYKTSKEGHVTIQANLLEDALDRAKNRVYNISGDLIANEDIESFNAKSAKLNIILVVSGGRKNGQYINNLQGVLETEAWRNAARDNFREVNIGAVVYRDYGPGCDNAITPLSNDYRIVDEFLSEQRKVENDGCDDNKYYQGMYGGIIKAAKMLHDHSNESNIILVYGSGSDDTPRKGEAIRSIQNVNARLLFFQTHNIPNEPAYISFVGDARELIIKSAENITELKKKIIVPNTYPNILNGVAFTNDSTGRIQQLDYPKRAITQGFLLFPHDSENMPAKYLADCLDSLLTSIAIDNRTISYGLRSAVAQSGSGSTKIKPGFAYRFPKYQQEKIPLNFLKANTLSGQDFLIPAWLMLPADEGRDVQPGLTAGVLLSEKEYNDFANQLAMLGGNGNYDSKSGVIRQITDAIEKTKSQQNVKLDRSAKELTFSEALGFICGYFPVDPVWRSTTLSEYQSSDKISREIGSVFLSECRSKATWLHDHNNNSNLQIRNNNRTYYIINEQHLPVNTFLDQQPQLKETVAGNNKPATASPTTADNITDAPVTAQPAGNKNSKNETKNVPVTNTKSSKKENGNNNNINDDLAAISTTGNNNSSKEDNRNIGSKDTVNYRKRITTTRQADDDNSKRSDNNKTEDVHKDPDQANGQESVSPATTSGEKNGTTAGQSEDTTPKKKTKKQTAERKTADLDKDLSEIKGTTSAKAGSNATARQTRLQGGIKKEQKGNNMQEELSKFASPKDSSLKQRDTIDYRARIREQ